jgi:hypothetical protein
MHAGPRPPAFAPARQGQARGQAQGQPGGAAGGGMAGGIGSSFASADAYVRAMHVRGGAAGPVRGADRQAGAAGIPPLC